MAAPKWPLLALTALLCSVLCSGHRATGMAEEPAPFGSEPNRAPGISSPPQVRHLVPPKPPPKSNRAPAPAPISAPSPSLMGRSIPASGPPSSPTRPSATPARIPSPVDAPAPATGPLPAPSMEFVARPSPEISPAPFPPTTMDTDESNIAINCCGAGWGSPGCGGTSCPGGGGAGCGATPCPSVPKNPYYCQPAGCGSNQAYSCGGFTIYMDDHFTSGEKKS